MKKLPKEEKPLDEDREEEVDDSDSLFKDEPMHTPTEPEVTGEQEELEEDDGIIPYEHEPELKSSDLYAIKRSVEEIEDATGRLTGILTGFIMDTLMPAIDSKLNKVFSGQKNLHRRVRVIEAQRFFFQDKNFIILLGMMSLLLFSLIGYMFFENSTFRWMAVFLSRVFISFLCACGMILTGFGVIRGIQTLNARYKTSIHKEEYDRIKFIEAKVKEEAIDDEKMFGLLMETQAEFQEQLNELDTSSKKKKRKKKKKKRPDDDDEPSIVEEVLKRSTKDENE